MHSGMGLLKTLVIFRSNCLPNLFSGHYFGLTIMLALRGRLWHLFPTFNDYLFILNIADRMTSYGLDGKPGDPGPVAL